MSHTRAAFTLIELLVCVAIISILASLLLPALAQVKEFAQKTVCISNMQQMGSASAMYLQDYDETFALSLYVSGDTPRPNGQIFSIYDLMLPYLGKTSVFQCPSEPKAFDYSKVAELYGLTPQSDVTYASYVPNPGLFTCGCASQLVRKHDVRFLSNLPYPSDQPAFYEGFLSAWLDTPVEGRHHGSMNVAMSDGHAHFMKLTKNPSPVGFNSVSAKFVDQWIIEKGPFRLPPDTYSSKVKTWMMFGIVIDPDCNADVTAPCNTNPPCFN